MGNPLKIPTMPCKTYKYPPKLGEHTKQVLSELLNFSEEKLNDLQRKGSLNSHGREASPRIIYFQKR